MYLPGLSTRDPTQVLPRHFGERFDTTEISRMVDGVSAELDAGCRRALSSAKFRFPLFHGSTSMCGATARWSGLRHFGRVSGARVTFDGNMRTA